MKTFQDYEQNKGNIESFILSAIADYQSSDAYNWAIDGINYSSGKNTFITNRQNVLHDINGRALVDDISPNYKIASNFYGIFVKQRNAFVLGNGIEFEKEDTKKKLGKEFDHLTFFGGQDTLTQGVVYGFWNVDHIEYFPASQICPLFDEETGALRVAIRFWRATDNSVLRITLFEEDGITEYREKRKTGENGSTINTLITIEPKRAYKVTNKLSKASGAEYNSGENYSTLPIIPWYSFRNKQVFLESLKDKIDAYDVLTSIMVNDADDGFVYWVFTNCQGMNTDAELQKALERIRSVHAVVVDQGDEATPHTIEPPYSAKMSVKDCMRSDLYRDAMALDTDVLKAGNVTATQINAAYEPLNEAADEFEFCTIQYITSLLELLGIDDYPKFTRSMERNKVEETNMVLAAGNFIDRDTVIDKLPFLTPEEKKIAKDRAAAEETARFEAEELNGLGAQTNGQNVVQTGENNQ